MFQNIGLVRFIPSFLDKRRLPFRELAHISSSDRALLDLDTEHDFGSSVAESSGNMEINSVGIFHSTSNLNKHNINTTQLMLQIF